MPRKNTTKRELETAASHEAEKKAQLHRLRRAEGQIRGLQQMILDDRECTDVSVQIDAVISALKRVQAELVRQAILECSEAAYQGKVSEAEMRRHVDALARLIARMK